MGDGMKLTNSELEDLATNCAAGKFYPRRPIPIADHPSLDILKKPEPDAKRFLPAGADFTTNFLKSERGDS